MNINETLGNADFSENLSTLLAKQYGSFQSLKAYKDALKAYKANHNLRTSYVLALSCIFLNKQEEALKLYETDVIPKLDLEKSNLPESYLKEIHVNYALALYANKSYKKAFAALGKDFNIANNVDMRSLTYRLSIYFENDKFDEIIELSESIKDYLENLSKLWVIPLNIYSLLSLISNNKKEDAIILLNNFLIKLSFGSMKDQSQELLKLFIESMKESLINKLIKPELTEKENIAFANLEKLLRI